MLKRSVKKDELPDLTGKRYSKKALMALTSPRGKSRSSKVNKLAQSQALLTYAGATKASTGFGEEKMYSPQREEHHKVSSDFIYTAPKYPKNPPFFKQAYEQPSGIIKPSVSEAQMRIKKVTKSR